MQMTEHFQLEDFIQAPYGTGDRIKVLCESILEPIRQHFNKPLIINSGFRSQEHNNLVGGVPTSYHLYEADHAAADFYVAGESLQAVFDWIRLESGLPFDEVILERDHKTYRDACVHIQINTNPRRIAKVGETHGTGQYTSVEVK
jgi:Peptidase M15